MLKRPLIFGIPSPGIFCFLHKLCVKLSNIYYVSEWHFAHLYQVFSILSWIALCCFVFLLALLFFLQYKPFDLLIFLHQFSGRCATGTIYFTPISCLTNNRRHLYSPTKILCASSLNSHPQCYSRFFPLSTKSPCAFNGPEEQCWPCEGFPFVQGRGISQKQNLTNASQRQWIFVFQSVGKVGSELGGKSTLT